MDAPEKGLLRCELGRASWEPQGKTSWDGDDLHLRRGGCFGLSTGERGLAALREDGVEHRHIASRTSSNDWTTLGGITKGSSLWRGSSRSKISNSRWASCERPKIDRLTP